MSDNDLIKLYSGRILQLAASIPHLGRLPAPGATARKRSPICGSTVTVDLVMRDGRVAEFAQDVKACALGQASSSIMARHVVGSRADDLKALRETMHKMLKEEGPPPTGRWADCEALLPVRDFKARHASTLLTFDAVVDAVNQIEAKEKEPA